MDRQTYRWAGGQTSWRVENLTGMGLGIGWRVGGWFVGGRAEEAGGTEGQDRRAVQASGTCRRNRHHITSIV